MTFVFGINEKDGIYVYEREFDEEGFNTKDKYTFIAVMKDCNAYYKYADNTPNTDIGIWDNYYDANKAYIKGCCDVISRYLDPPEITGNYFFKSDTVSFTLRGETKYYRVLGIYYINSVRIEHRKDSFAFIANVNSAVFREKCMYPEAFTSEDELSFVHIDCENYNEHIVQDILDGKAERWSGKKVDSNNFEIVLIGKVKDFFKNFIK